jgi:hypothetical protein
METVYKGERICEGVYKSGDKKNKPCDKPAYYLLNGYYFCGAHCKDKNRIELKVNPKKKEISAAANDDRQDQVVVYMTQNMEAGRFGEVIATKLYGRKNPDHKEGFMSVFPNNKHGNRTDGLGMHSLSPMRMGPIHHFCPGVGPASCLENFWQGSKQYVCETELNGDPSKEYFKTRDAMFLNPEPQRHKAVSKFESGVKHSVWFDERGQRHFLSYVESRQVYCEIYEYFALKTEDFATLKEAMESGMNLNIIGYDAHNVRRHVGKTLKEQFEAAYLDASVPFGHEVCLQALLLLAYDDRPWRKHRTITVFKHLE